MKPLQMFMMPETLRNNCKKYNNKTVDGGVVLAYMIQGAKGACPIKILKVVRGAWHGSKAMGSVKLTPKGPV